MILSSQIYMFLIVVLTVHNMNQSFKPRENAATYMHESRERLYTRLVSLDTKLRQAVDQHEAMLQSIFKNLRNEDTTTHTSAPTPKGNILCNISLYFMFYLKPL